MLHLWRGAKDELLNANKEIENTEKHHKIVFNEITSILKEVNCSTLRDIADQLKAERANRKLLTEKNYLSAQRFGRLRISYDNVCEEKKNLQSNYDHLLVQIKNKSKEYEELQALYADALLTNTKLKMEKEKAENGRHETENMYNVDFEYLNRCNQNQANTITKQMHELSELRTELAEQKELVKKHMAKSEKLQSRLDKASKRYGELIKLISDKAIKSI